MRWARAAAPALLVLATAACAAPPTPSLTAPPMPTLSEERKLLLIDEQRDVRWQQVVAQYPSAVRPVVTMVRMIDFDDWASTQAECLVSEGFDATASDDGGLFPSDEIPLEQQEALAVAMYVCDTRYPIDPAYSQPPTEAELEYLYDYFDLVLTPCLEAHGVEVPAGPSKATFVDRYGHENPWDPYVNVRASGVDWTKINVDCPQLPRDLR